MSKYIPLTQGRIALVDSEDYEYLSQWKWHAIKQGNSYYACRAEQYYENGKRKTKHYSMHREIMGLNHGDCRHTDHINHLGLDNRKCNLRVCSKKENAYNQLPRKGVSSKYKGVWRHQNKWRSCIMKDGKRTYLGMHDSETEAANAYNVAAEQLFGEFACLNVAG